MLLVRRIGALSAKIMFLVPEFSEHSAHEDDEVEQIVDLMFSIAFSAKPVSRLLDPGS